MPAPNWTETQLFALRQMAGEGATAREIANKTGKSRNAVIGQARRKGILLLGIGAVAVKQNKPVNKPMEFVSTPTNTGPTTINGKSFHEEIAPGDIIILESPEFSPTLLIKANLDQCRWIEGPVNHRHTEICGERTLLGTSWCKEHTKRVFNRASAKGRAKYSRFT